MFFAVVAAGVFFFLFNGLFSRGNYYNDLTGEVKLEKLQVRIVERGALESSENEYIKVKVKPKKGTSIQINWVIDDGTEVKKGDPLLGPNTIGLLNSALGNGPLVVAPSLLIPGRRGDKLVDLDATPLKDELVDQKIKEYEAMADMIAAQTDYEITLKQTSSDWEVAKLELKAYMEGDYEVAKDELKMKIVDAKALLAQARDKSAWSKRMYDRGIISKIQKYADVASAISAEINLDLLRKQLDVLKGPTNKKTEKELITKRDLAKLAMKAKRAQAEAKRKTKEDIYEQEMKKRVDIEAQIANSVIYADHREGLVVYYISQQSRWGRGNQQSMTAQGETVDYDQKLMQIPDLKKMQVKVEVHEAMIKYLPRNLDGLDSADRPQATIRLSAFPNRFFTGYLQSVAAIASQNNFLNSDVRVYETMIGLDPCESLSKKELKPGMSAEVTILAYETPTEVLTIPIQAVVGNITMGKKRKCYVIDGNGYALMRDIVIGKSNERVVEVKSGLKQGERVALKPESLLPSDGSLRAAKPGERRDRFSGPGRRGGGGPPGGGNQQRGRGNKGAGKGNSPERAPGARSGKKRGS